MYKSDDKWFCEAERMRHIYIEEPYGPEAISFYEFVFGAKVINKATERINTNRGTTRFVSSELQFGPNCITVSEWNPNSYVVDESTTETPTIIWLDMKDIDPVVTRAKKLDIVIDEEDLSTSSYWRLTKIEDPYGIIWMVRSLLLDSSKDIKDAKRGHEVEEAEKVTIWEKQQQIYVKQPNGHKAINFCKSVFGAKEVTSNEQTKMVNEKASTSPVISELNFGRKSIIVSEVEVDDSSLIDKNDGSGVGTPDYIFVEAEHIPSTIVVALGLGAYCGIVKTDVGRLTKITDPFGNTWLARSRTRPPAPVKRNRGYNSGYGGRGCGGRGFESESRDSYKYGGGGNEVDTQGSYHAKSFHDGNAFSTTETKLQ